MKYSQNKSKIIGLIILGVVILAAVAYTLFTGLRPEVKTVSGYVGGEKIGVFEDPEIQKILADRYHLKVDYSKSGSLDMVRADLTGRDFLWPSSQTALEFYEQTHGKPKKSENIFNSPIVIYSYQPVVDALLKEGLIRKAGEVNYLDMEKFTEEYLAKPTKWKDINLDLYGYVSIATTDPSKSNSGNMFSGLIANNLNNSEVVDANSVNQVLPKMKEIFGRLGYMNTSSADLFNEYLTKGYGARPMVAGYENQLLEFSKEQPAVWEQVKDKVVIIYPDPTVWSSHIMISLSDQGNELILALQDPDIQKLAWEKHGFRTGVAGAASETGSFEVTGLSTSINHIMPMPNYDAMDRIIRALE